MDQQVVMIAHYAKSQDLAAVYLAQKVDCIYYLFAAELIVQGQFIVVAGGV